MVSFFHIHNPETVFSRAFFKQPVWIHLSLTVDRLIANFHRTLAVICYADALAGPTAK
jgi:hypothetical protein